MTLTDLEVRWIIFTALVVMFFCWLFIGTPGNDLQENELDDVGDEDPWQ